MLCCITVFIVCYLLTLGSPTPISAPPVTCPFFLWWFEPRALCHLREKVFPSRGLGPLPSHTSGSNIRCRTLFLRDVTPSRVPGSPVLFPLFGATKVSREASLRHGPRWPAAPPRLPVPVTALPVHGGGTTRGLSRFDGSGGLRVAAPKLNLHRAALVGA